MKSISNRESLFDESKSLESDIKKQLAGVAG